MATDHRTSKRDSSVRSPNRSNVGDPTAPNQCSALRSLLSALTCESWNRGRGWLRFVLRFLNPSEPEPRADSGGEPAFDGGREVNDRRDLQENVHGNFVENVRHAH